MKINTFTRHIKAILATSALLLCTAAASSAEPTGSKAIPAPFTKGVNLTTWFETWSKGSSPDLNLYTKQDFVDLKEMGADVIRLPVHFDMFAEDTKGHPVDEIIFEFIDRACDWAEELEMYLIIDNHSYNQDPYPSCQEATDFLKDLWPQIAKRYSRRSKYILYEILNEPRLKKDEWFPLQENIIKVIRKYDKKHTIVVTGSDWGSLKSLSSMKPYSDKNLIYTFHYYDPFVFTHQGASWTDKYEAALHDVPFPYDADRLPPMEGILKNSYLERTLKYDYKQQSDTATMKRTLLAATYYSQQNQVPVYVGEMGVYSKAAPYEDRVRWYKEVGRMFQELNLPFTVWGYDDQFGFFRKGSAKQYPYDLDVDIIRGLGFNVPLKAGTKNQDTAEKIKLPFTFMDDYYSTETVFLFNSKTGSAKIVKTQCPEGDYALRINDLGQYENGSFTFRKMDLSNLNNVDENLRLNFHIKFTQPNQQVTVRFVYREDETTIPWRFEKNIMATNSNLNRWVEMSIPLSQFVNKGAWIGATQTWKNPDLSVQRDWTKMEKFSIVMEHQPLKGEVYFDNIVLTTTSPDKP